MAGAVENERPQRADIMLLIRPGLLVKEDSRISVVHRLCVYLQEDEMQRDFWVIQIVNNE